MTKLPISLNTVTPNVPVVVATEAVTQLVQHGVQAYSHFLQYKAETARLEVEIRRIKQEGRIHCRRIQAEEAVALAEIQERMVQVQGVQHTAAQALQNLAESSRTHAQSTDQLIALAGNPALSAAERAEVLALVKQNLNGYATFSQRAEKLCDQAFERYESPSLKKEKGFVYEQGS